LIIELDGSQHLDSVEYDKERTEYFESLGIKVIRFWNNEINNNINGVIMRIEEELRQPSTAPSVRTDTPPRLRRGKPERKKTSNISS
jgi:crossover junction endodeoxyribonuclease RuvC